MKAKDKAEELIEKFEHKTKSLIKDNLAIQCAIICVDEITEVISKYSIHSDCPEDADLEYWQEVKKELQSKQQ